MDGNVHQEEKALILQGVLFLEESNKDRQISECLGKEHQQKILSARYSARVGGTKNNTINLIVGQYVYLKVMFWYFFTYNEFDRKTQPQHNTTNITTMVVEPLALPAVWIQ
jgi:hypothetical protein